MPAPLLEQRADAPVLVTGASGFIGGAVAQRLIEGGHRVRALVRRPDEALARAGAVVCLGDIRDPERVRETVDGCALVFHLAAKPSLGGPRGEFEAVNVHGTQHVVDACRAGGAKFLVHTSTPSVVFTGRPLRGANEQVALAGTRSLYSETKAAAEQVVIGANGPQLTTVALRPHAVWGPGDRHLMPRLIERAKRGRLRRIGHTRPVIDLTYIDNAVDAHILAANVMTTDPGRVGGRAYFVTDGAPVRLWEVVERVVALVGYSVGHRPVPRPLAYAAAYAIEAVWRAGRLRSEPPITRYLLDLISQDHWFDISAARRDLGYEPRVRLEEGLARMRESLQRAGL